MLMKTVLREGQALARENGAALEVVRNIREVRWLVIWWGRVGLGRVDGCGCTLDRYL